MSDEESTTTLQVMLRLLPPPRALLVVKSERLRTHLEPIMAASLLDVEAVTDDTAALRRLAKEFCPVLITESLELIRHQRAQVAARDPFVICMIPSDSATERERGFAAGADECIAVTSTESEWRARLTNARRVSQLESVLRTTLAENRKLSAVDDLTKVASRRFFAKNYPREVERAARYGRPLSLILCDIDHFKSINDAHGHPGGDEVLRQFGQRLQQLLRSRIDWVARLGGEEFAIVLPETPYAAAYETASKLRTWIVSSPFTVHERPLKVTASFGLCALERVATGERDVAERMIQAADAALYRSKQGGRDRVTAVGSTMAHEPRGAQS